MDNQHILHNVPLNLIENITGKQKKTIWASREMRVFNKSLLYKRTTYPNVLRPFMLNTTEHEIYYAHKY